MAFEETLKFFGLVLSSSLLSSLITQIWATWNDRRKERISENKEAVYAALQVAIRLESFALASITKLVRHQNEQFEAEMEHGGAIVKFVLPDFFEYPHDLAWRDLDGQLAAYALAFPNEVELSRAALEESFVANNRKEHIEQSETQVGLRGYQATILASKFRQRYDLPFFHPRAPDFDFVKALRQRYENLFHEHFPYRHPYDEM